MGVALITDDGEALEGETLEDVSILSVVTYLINKVPCFCDERRRYIPIEPTS